MPTAVLDLELERLPRGIEGLERYESALALVRLRGRPVGQVGLLVSGARISEAELHEALRNQLTDVVTERWLALQLGLEELEFDRGVSNVVPAGPATVAVCTRDRPEDLRRCLTALSPLVEQGHEILVIDNCPSTDASRHVVEAFHARYFREDRPGASAARNRALREARHDIVAFSDDDATPDREWLPTLLRNFNDPLVLCVTGLLMPLELETPAQEWFERFSPHGRGFRRVVHDVSDRHPLQAWQAGVSASMAVRRSVLELVGPFDEALGIGTPSQAGEDYELFARIIAAGYRIVYDPAALSWHRHRRTWDELVQTQYGYGVGVYAAWTHQLVVQRELLVAKFAWQWFFYGQLPRLIRSLCRRPGRIPLPLLLAELRGCVAGPAAYFVSRRANARRVVSQAEGGGT